MVNVFLCLNFSEEEPSSFCCPGEYTFSVISGRPIFSCYIIFSFLELNFSFKYFVFSIFFASYFHLTLHSLTFHLLQSHIQQYPYFTLPIFLDMCQAILGKDTSKGHLTFNNHHSSLRAWLQGTT